MSPGFQVIVGCLGLSLVQTYAWWSVIRVELLRSDLGRIGRDFEAVMKRRGLSADPEVDDFRLALEKLIESAHLNSPAVIGPISRLPGVTLADCLGPGAEPFLSLFLDSMSKTPDLRFALRKALVRLGYYLAFETFSGWVSIAKEVFFDSSILKWPEAVAEPTTRDSLEVLAMAKLLSRGQYRQTA